MIDDKFQTALYRPYAIITYGDGVPFKIEVRLQQMIKSYAHTNCRACNEKLPPAFLDLGMQPLANNLCTDTDHEDETFPLRLCRCSKCGLMQLDTVVDPSAMFSHYLYTPSQSKKMLEHFDGLAAAVAEILPEKGLAVDCGSNDGALLEFLKNRGWKICGIDPAENLVKEANEKGLMTICDFLSESSVHEVLKLYGKANLITACNVFAHTPDWQNFVRCVDKLLTLDGQLVIEFPYGPTMLSDGTADLAYSEHASFPSLIPIAALFNPFGLYIDRVDYFKDIHGGSVRVWIGRANTTSWLPNLLNPIVAISKYVQWRILNEHNESETCSIESCDKFVKKVTRNLAALRETIKAEKTNGRRVIGYTSPAKCVTLLVAAGLGKDDISCIVDDNPLKQDRYLPKLHIPVVSSSKAALNPETDTVVIFAWNVADDIMSKLPKGTRAIIPMPAVHVVNV